MAIGATLRISITGATIKAHNHNAKGTQRLAYMQVLAVNRGLSTIAASGIVLDLFRRRLEQAISFGTVTVLHSLCCRTLIRIATTITGIKDFLAVAQSNTVRCGYQTRNGWDRMVDFFMPVDAQIGTERGE